MLCQSYFGSAHAFMAFVLASTTERALAAMDASARSMSRFDAVGGLERKWRPDGPGGQRIQRQTVGKGHWSCPIRTKCGHTTKEAA